MKIVTLPTARSRVRVPRGQPDGNRKMLRDMTDDEIEIATLNEMDAWARRQAIARMRDFAFADDEILDAWESRADEYEASHGIDWTDDELRFLAPLPPPQHT